MQAQDTLKMHGRLKIEVRDEQGQVKEVKEIPNLVVTTGKDFIASRMKDTTNGAMSHMAVGTDDTPAAVGQTGLAVELARVALTSTSVTGSTVTYIAAFPPGTGTGGLVEAAILNASTAGIMLCRTTFSVINKGARDSMSITWTVTVS
jgi:hypothetical protein